MSKSAPHARRRKHARRPEQARRASDSTIYAGLILIGVFVVALAVPLTQGDHWQEVAVGYVIAMAWLVNLYGFRAWRGVHLANWQAALARIPLRFIGYGRKGGKPIEAAAGHDDAGKAIIVSVIVSVLIIVTVALALIPAWRPW
jgi:hypothetical protein